MKATCTLITLRLLKKNIVFVFLQMLLFLFISGFRLGFEPRLIASGLTQLDQHRLF